MRITLAVLALAAAGLVNGPAGTGPLLALVCLYLVLVVMPAAHVEKVIKAALAASVFVTVVALAQRPFVPRPPSIFASPNFLGALAAIMLFLAWQSGHRVAIGANALSLCLAQSRGALVAVGAGLLVMLWRHSRIAAIAAPVIAIGAIALARPDWEPIAERLAVWEAAVYSVKWHILTGSGFAHPFVFANGTFYHRFYSIPLDWFAATGLVGISIGVWLAVEVWRAGPHYRPLLAAWFVQGLFISAHPATMVPFFAVLALLSAPSSRQASSPALPSEPARPCGASPARSS